MAAKILPGEKAILEELGWKEGDPIPDNFAQILASAGKDSARSALQAAKQAPTLAGEKFTLPPEVQAAVDAAAGFKSLDITEPAPEAKKEKKAPEPVKAEEETQASGVCINCGWDQSVSDVAPITDADKTQYVASVVSNRLYFKSYPLFGGSVTVTFRNLRPSELDACFFQKNADLSTETGRIVSDFEHLTRYRIALGLAELRYDDGRIERFPESIDRWREALGKDNASPRDIYNHITANFIASESMWRTLTKVSLTFTYQLRRLEEASLSENFWKPTR